jgi:hypothetical protein
MPLARRAAVLLTVSVTLPCLAQGQQPSPMPESDRVRLAEAFRLAEVVRPVVWPGWERTPMAVLLVAGGAEYLVGHARPTSDFVVLGRDSLLGREVYTRPARHPPTLLATFPAVAGVATIVVGSAERTGKSSAEWVLTLLHEHFHQWQSSRPDYYTRADALGLARGDTTGQWMLDYRFPYDAAPVDTVIGALAASLGRALDASPAGVSAAIRSLLRDRESLRRVLSPGDDRYLEFQLWQEGVPRYVELASAEAAASAGTPIPAFRRLPDYESYGVVAARLSADLRRKLTGLSLGRDRRVAFYPLGAALALLLDRTDRGWKRTYGERLFAIWPLLSP